MSFNIDEAMGNFCETIHTTETREEAQEWLSARLYREVTEELDGLYLDGDLDEIEAEFNNIYEDFSSYYVIEEV